MSTRIKVVIGVAVALVLGLVAYASVKSRDKNVVRVTTAKVTKAPLVATVSCNGRVRAKTKVDISSQVMGQIVTLAVVEGEHVKKGDLLVRVHELETITAEIVLPEKEIGDVQVGQPVAVKVRAYPYQTFYGKVTSIATTATSSLDGNVTPAAAPIDEGEGPRAVLVTSQIENGSHLLKPELTGKVKIYCGQRPIIDLMTRRLARYVRVEFWSWW